ncbi:Transcriptional regulatory protein MalR [Propionispora sp. 2/2-37]|uniref:response regulator n=1 Tax=Propionispora sp. 2/2-37 TaxID=1677858 RepID=UPI0006BB57EA|nr:response regulator [Propionispora sp. 2/2-37]CUH97313.1 Transcriptional regulatory protein MalR [Propionispora sp. 2/2-37]
MIKVLIVEDDPMVAELNRRYLEKLEGFAPAAIVHTADEALQYLKNQVVDLVLLDIFMPGMNGLELLSAIRRQQYGVDIILVTAAKDTRSVQTALRQGAVDYLIKPFEFKRFQTALHAFRQRMNLIRNQEQFCQTQLDEQVFSQHTRLNKTELPKGLDQNTLKHVWSCIAAAKDSFTAKEMAQQVGISQVSIRKYLKYLESQELLQVHINYQAVGRPITIYRCTDPNTIPDFIE